MAGPDQDVGGRRRGRPLRLPEESTAFVDRFPDAWARVAWLLVSSRLLGAEPDLAHREAFAGRLREHGLAADPTRVSRWESGSQPVPARVLTAYETCLGLAPGTFVTISRSLLRAAGTPAPAAGRGILEGGPRQEVVERLIGIATRSSDHHLPALSGAEWLRLSMELARFDGLFMEARTWSLVCGRLLHELARTCGFDRLQRYEATVTLLSTTAARRPLLRALGEWLTDPDIQLVQPVLALLAEVGDDGIGDLVIRLMDDPNRRLADQAVGVAAAKVQRGHYDARTLAKLESYVHARTSNARSMVGLTMFDLAAQLPEATQRRLIETAGNAHLRQRLEMHLASGALVGSNVSGPVVRSLASAAQSEAAPSQWDDPDPMLQRLVKEMLFHVNGFRRYFAAHTLAVSPYADALARACIELTASPDTVVATGAWMSLQVLSHGRSGPEVIGLALRESRPDVRAVALSHLGHTTGDLDDRLRDGLVRMARSTDDDTVRLAVIAALGRSGAQSLPEVAELSERATRAAAWWQRIGPAIRDLEPSREEIRCH